MSHLMTCGDAPNCTWTDLACPTLAGVNCAKHWEDSLTVTIEDSMKEIILCVCRLFVNYYQPFRMRSTY